MSAPKAKNFSFYLSPEDQAFFAARTGAGEGPTRADVLTSLIAVYRRMLCQNLPDLATEEWCLVLDALGATVALPMSGTQYCPAYLEVADAIAIDKLDRKWGVADGAALIARLKALTFEQNVAVFDLALQFRSEERSAGSEEKPEARLQRLLTQIRTSRPKRGGLSLEG